MKTLIGTLALAWTLGHALAGPQASPGDRSVVGDLLGDGLVDLCAMEGSEIRARFSPGLYDCLMTDVLSVPATDFDIAEDGGRDRLFACTARGLASAHWDAVQRDWIETLEPTHPRWKNARFVRAVGQGSGQRPLIYGVMANGREIRLLTPAGSGFIDERVRVVGREVIALEDVSFVADGLPELAVLTSVGCTVYSGDPADIGSGPIVQSLTPVVPGETSLVAGSAGGAADSWVAFLHGPSSDPRASVTILEPSSASTTLSFQGTTPAGNTFQAGALGALDLDGDSDVDLLITNQALPSMVSLLDVSTSAQVPSFTWQQSSVREVQMPAAGSGFGDEAVFTADIDNDGDVDFGAGAAYLNDMVRVRNGRVEHVDLTPGIVLQEPLQPADLDLAEFQLDTDLDLSFSLRAAAVVPPGATDIQLGFWTKPDHLSPLTPEPILTRHVRLGTTAQIFDLRDRVTEDLAAPNASFFEICFFTIRYVSRDPATGDVTHVYPGHVYGIESRTMPGGSPSDNCNWLLTQWPGRGGPALEVILEAHGRSSFLGGGVGSGCGTGGECLPCQPDNPPGPGF